MVATGASPRMTGIPGEKELYGGKGVTTCATCDGAFYRTMEVAVIGGGDSAAEEALFLTRFASKVYLVHRRDSLRASKIMADRATTHEKIQCVWDSVPVAVEGVEQGAVSGLRVKNTKTGVESVLPRELWAPLEVRVRYRGYIERQQRTAASAAALESVVLDEAFWSRELTGLSKEALEKLRRWRPDSVGKASRIAGVSPSDVSVLLVYARRFAGSGRAQPQA